jgi:hypothetical protein
LITHVSEAYITTGLITVIRNILTLLILCLKFWHTCYTFAFILCSINFYYSLFLHWW